MTYLLNCLQVEKFCVPKSLVKQTFLLSTEHDGWDLHVQKGWISIVSLLWIGSVPGPLPHLNVVGAPHPGSKFAKQG